MALHKVKTSIFGHEVEFSVDAVSPSAAANKVKEMSVVEALNTLTVGDVSTWHSASLIQEEGA